MQYLSVVVLKSSEVKTFTMGYHAYNSIWTPTKDEQWHDAMQPTNVLGKYVVEKSLIERIEKEKVSNNPSSSVRDVWKRSSSPSLFHSILNFPPCFSSFLLLGFFELNIFLPKLFGVFLYLASWNTLYSNFNDLSNDFAMLIFLELSFLLFCCST